MDIADLKDYIVGAKEVAKHVDEDDINFCYKKTPMIFDWKNEGFRIEYILLNDIFNWLCYLGLGDGVIVDEEVDFINYCLDLNFTKEDLLKLSKSKLNKDFRFNMPVSFILFCEAEIVYKDSIINHSMPVLSENLFRLFGILGESFIACDGEISIDEKNIYESYITFLWQRLNDFKERRGFTSNYDSLIGENISEKDITIISDLNKKTINKMNLILKLFSQGYSIYDLDNIAYISLNIIVKWFHKGRLGDKKFEEFYLKCIKINSILEVEFDEIIEQIDMDEINDEILLKSDSEDIKNEYDLEPKNCIYRQHIIKLKSKFHFKEKNTRKLIDKCFPAPQMTNVKFNSDVDNCSKIFSQKYKSTMMMLESASTDSKNLDNEIKSNVEILKEIKYKLDMLHEELLIHISKSGDNDVELLLEDMGRLIDSVKDY